MHAAARDKTPHEQLMRDLRVFYRRHIRKYRRGFEDPLALREIVAKC